MKQEPYFLSKQNVRVSSFANVKGFKRNFQYIEAISHYPKKCETQSSHVCAAPCKSCTERFAQLKTNINELPNN